jgi:hypothetical protein
MLLAFDKPSILEESKTPKQQTPSSDKERDDQKVHELTEKLKFANETIANLID